MNKKIWIAALLVTVMAVAAGCGSKPTAAPNQTQGAGTENNVTEVEGETITEPVTAEPEENHNAYRIDGRQFGGRDYNYSAKRNVYGEAGNFRK